MLLPGFGQLLGFLFIGGHRDRLQHIQAVGPREGQRPQRGLVQPRTMPYWLSVKLVNTPIMDSWINFLTTLTPDGFGGVRPRALRRRRRFRKHGGPEHRRGY